MAILKNKKAAEMTIGTIIIIVLALVVLVFLIFAFSRGTGSLNDYISNLFSSGSNIDTLKNSCNAVCASQATYSFCEEVRTLKTNDGTFKGSCATLSSKGIDACQSFTCTSFPKKCEDPTIKGTWLSTRPGKTDCEKTEDDKTAAVGNSDGKDIKTDKCCALKPTVGTCDSLGGAWSDKDCKTLNPVKVDLTTDTRLTDKATGNPNPTQFKYCCSK